MRSMLFVVLFILVVATVVVSFAIGMQSQAEWASDLCRYGEPVCGKASFYSLAAATAVVAIYFLLALLINI